MWKLKYTQKKKKKSLATCKISVDGDGSTIVVHTRPKRVQKSLKPLLPTHLADYDDAMPALQDYCKDKNIELQGIPLSTRTYLRLRPMDYEVNMSTLTSIPTWATLYEFQRQGVLRALRKNKGKLMLCDQMGLGKSLQSLTIASYYRPEWPLLIICPSYLRMNWYNELQKWQIADNIQVVATGKDVIRDDAEVIVLSYGLMVKFASRPWPRTPGVAILDESHYIKNRKAKRTQATMGVVARMRRLICLSGTPALSRPSELYTQLHLMVPNTFRWFKHFATRYCDAKMGPFGWDVSGASNQTELSAIMSHLMIRRLKRNVLTQLPPKVREAVTIPLGPKERAVLQPTFEELELVNKKIFALEGNLLNKAVFERKRLMSELFTLSAKVKVSLLCDYLKHSVLPNLDHKVLVIAHHKLVLDALEAVVEKSRCGYVRIAGNTPQMLRPAIVNTFRSDDAKKIALLSQKACGTGLNMTMSSHVIFMELNWTPGEMLQCEDRTHRIGQEASSILIQYILAQGCIDEIIWKRLNAKFTTLDTIVDQGSNRDGFHADVKHSSESLDTLTSVYATKLACVHPKRPGESDADYIRRVGQQVTRDFVDLVYVPIESPYEAANQQVVNVSESSGIGSFQAYYCVIDSTADEDVLLYDGMVLIFGLQCSA